MNKDLEDAMAKGQAAFIERERLWTMHEYGRWVVIVSAHGRVRARRFASLSRARAFARKVGGKVRRWRRTGIRGSSGWRLVSPWQMAFNSVPTSAIFISRALADAAGIP